MKIEVTRKDLGKQTNTLNPLNLGWFQLLLFHDISTFVGYLISKSSWQKNSCDLTHSYEDNGVIQGIS